MNTRAMIAATIERIGARRCPSSLVRRAEAGGAVDELWDALAQASLDRATAPEAAGGAGLAWRDALPLVLASGQYAMPVPLVESLGAHALAAAAGLQLPAGAAAFAPMRAGDAPPQVADLPWGDRVVSVVGVSADGELRVLEAARAEALHRRNQAGEVRSSMSWPDRQGRIARIDASAVVHLGAALRAAQIAGAMQAVLNMTVRYAGDRVQFGRPIGRFQAVQQQLALMAELVAQATIGAELAFDGNGPLFDPLRAACAKQVASANALQCASIAHSVHGAIGITAEHDLQLFTRRLRAWASDWGGAHHWALVLGRGILHGVHGSLWHAVIDASSTA